MPKAMGLGKIRLGLRTRIMGCICSKGGGPMKKLAKKHSKGGKDKEAKRQSSKRNCRKEEIVLEMENGNLDITPLIVSDEKSVGPAPQGGGGLEEKEKEKEKKRVVRKMKKHHTMDVGGGGLEPQINRMFSVRNGVDGAQVVAGWPSWLTAAAGEAIKGWVPRKADSFEKLDKIGEGTYSSVYRALDLDTGTIVALKKVRFVNMDPESVRFMAREILILRRLDHPNVMKLEGLVTSRVSGQLHLVFEYMEHDLGGLAASPDVKFDESQIKCYMQQLFRGLEHCHSRGVLHRDIKGSNLLIDNNGTLKIGDFGLATFYRANQVQPLTSRVVTLWYRPPELLLGATNYRVNVDMWSSGCILAELYVGKPIMPGRTEVEQLHKIFKLCGSPSDDFWQKSKLQNATIFKPKKTYERRIAETFKDLSPSSLSLLDSLLSLEPERRGTASSALENEFFTTAPLPCDPSALPKYPPCKEYDARMRDEMLRRQNGSGGKDSEGAAPAPGDLAKLQAAIKKWQGQLKLKKRGGMSEVDNSRRCGGSELRRHVSFKARGGVGQLPMFCNSAAPHTASIGLDLCREDISVNSHWHRLAMKYNRVIETESVHHYQNDEQQPRKDNMMGYVPQSGHIHYSGPLIPAGGNIDEMLKEHEKQVQNAVRKARLDKTSKAQKGNIDYGQTESLLQYVGNPR
nr:probable serine/threonine-protein kinase At1g09600 [Ipomoea batatas]GMD08912.1 probable serine/threonine-protein kinase At1g09600 [Ipomoea batatas]